MRSLEEIEKGFAYVRATGVIVSSCVPFEIDNAGVWWDLDTAEVDLLEELKYLESRHLILHHASSPNLIQLCDEGDPVRYGLTLTEPPSEPLRIVNGGKA
jgi:hypothetical protein